MAYSEPLRNPNEAFGDLNENQYRAELELVDRYQSFVAELLRLSLLGIAAFGFLYKTILGDPQATKLLENIDLAIEIAGYGVLMFGICAMSALIFRNMGSKLE
jgi:hypothetical protein